MRKDFCLLAYTVCIGIALVAGGCNDWLDVKPKSQAESEELFSREQGFKDALTACYIKMNSTSYLRILIIHQVWLKVRLSLFIQIFTIRLFRQIVYWKICNFMVK